MESVDEPCISFASGQPPLESYVRTTNANPNLNSMHTLMIMISFVDKMVEWNCDFRYGLGGNT